MTKYISSKYKTRGDYTRYVCTIEDIDSGKIWEELFLGWSTGNYDLDKTICDNYESENEELFNVLTKIFDSRLRYYENGKIFNGNVYIKGYVLKFKDGECIDSDVTNAYNTKEISEYIKFRNKRDGKIKRRGEYYKLKKEFEKINKGE